MGEGGGFARWADRESRGRWLTATLAPPLGSYRSPDASLERSFRGCATDDPPPPDHASSRAQQRGGFGQMVT